MKRSQPETSGVPPAKKQVLTKMIPPVNIGSVSTEVRRTDVSAIFVLKMDPLEFVV